MTGKWRQPIDDAERSPLSAGVRDIRFDHPVYTGREPAKEPPSVRVGLRLGCEPVTPGHMSTSEIRRAFLRVLAQPCIANLVEALTYTDGAAWTPRGGHGRHHYSAALAGSQEHLAPAAWAQILLPEPNGLSFWRDPLCADFVLHIEPRTRHGKPASAQDLASWHRHLTGALAVPQAIATSLLTEELCLGTKAEPSTKVAVWFTTRDDLTHLVDVKDSERLAGTRVLPWFHAYAVADSKGQPPSALAIDWLRQMCDDALHLDGYEPILLTLDRH
ncbi:hypothetical protein [Flindersiella endophytica]